MTSLYRDIHPGYSWPCVTQRTYLGMSRNIKTGCISFSTECFKWILSRTQERWCWIVTSEREKIFFGVKPIFTWQNVAIQLRCLHSCRIKSTFPLHIYIIVFLVVSHNCSKGKILLMVGLFNVEVTLCCIKMKSYFYFSTTVFGENTILSLALCCWNLDLNIKRC